MSGVDEAAARLRLGELFSLACWLPHEEVEATELVDALTDRERLAAPRREPT